MPSCSSCGDFVAIDADACPACGGKAKHDLDDSIRRKHMEETPTPAKALFTIVLFYIVISGGMTLPLQFWLGLGLGTSLLISLPTTALIMFGMFANHSE